MIFNATTQRFKLKKKPPNDHLFNLADRLKSSGTLSSKNLDKFIKANSLLLAEDVEKELTTIKNNIIYVTKRVHQVL